MRRDSRSWPVSAWGMTRSISMPAPATASSYESVFNYDAHNDRLVVIRLYGKENPGERAGVYAWDPETNAGAQRTLVRGFSFATVPIPRSVMLSITTSF